LAFPVRVNGRGTSRRRRLVPWVIAGYSCDGTDVIARDVPLPDDLQSGDEVVFEHAGAYTVSYSTPFCGIDGPTVECVDGASASETSRVQRSKSSNNDSPRARTS